MWKLILSEKSSKLAIFCLTKTTGLLQFSLPTFAVLVVLYQTFSDRKRSPSAIGCQVVPVLGKLCSIHEGATDQKQIWADTMKAEHILAQLVCCILSFSSVRKYRLQKSWLALQTSDIFNTNSSNKLCKNEQPKNDQLEVYRTQTELWWWFWAGLMCAERSRFIFQLNSWKNVIFLGLDLKKEDIFLVQISH